jgi:hypothetical protein
MCRCVRRASSTFCRLGAWPVPNFLSIGRLACFPTSCPLGAWPVSQLLVHWALGLFPPLVVHSVWNPSRGPYDTSWASCLGRAGRAWRAASGLTPSCRSLALTPALPRVAGEPAMRWPVEAQYSLDCSGVAPQGGERLARAVSARQTGVRPRKHLRGNAGGELNPWKADTQSGRHEWRPYLVRARFIAPVSSRRGLESGRAVFPGLQRGCPARRGEPGARGQREADWSPCAQYPWMAEGLPRKAGRD